MRKIFYSFCILFSLAACVSSKHAKTSVSAIPETISLSNGFRMFWDDFVQDVGKTKKLNKYIPSQLLIDKYVLRQQNGVYMVVGFIELTDAFPIEKFTKEGGNITNYTKNKRSFSVPINYLPEMCQLPGIKRIELNSKIKK